MGSQPPRQQESLRAEPTHWELAVRKCFHPSLQACSETPATLTYQASKATVLKEFHYCCCSAGGGCGSCNWLGHSMVKLVPLVFSRCLCYVLELGRTQRNKKEGPCDMERQRTVGVGGKGDSQGDRKDGRKVKDWGKQMCTCVYSSKPFPCGPKVLILYWCLFFLFLLLPLSVGLFPVKSLSLLEKRAMPQLQEGFKVLQPLHYQTSIMTTVSPKLGPCLPCI